MYAVSEGRSGEDDERVAADGDEPQSALQLRALGVHPHVFQLLLTTSKGSLVIFAFTKLTVYIYT